MKIRFLSLLIVFSIVGCFGSPAKMAMISEDDLKEVKTLELCAAYGEKLFGLEKVKKELIARLISYQHGLEDRTVVVQRKPGEVIAMHQKKSGIKAKLPDKGEISSKPQERSGESGEIRKLKRLMKVKLAEQSPPDGWEWELIEKGEIKKGMSQCGLLASKGMPAQIVKGSRKDEWIYQGYFSYLSVYVRKGKIKSWKE